MATIYIQSNELGTYYVTCANFAQAYYQAALLSVDPRSFYSISNDFTTKIIHTIQEYPFFICIYQGTHFLHFNNNEKVVSLQINEFLENDMIRSKINEIQAMKRLNIEMKRFINVQLDLLQKS